MSGPFPHGKYCCCQHYHQNRLFHSCFNFWHGPSYGKSVDTTAKSAQLKLVKLQNFKVVCRKQAQSCENFQAFARWGASLCPHHTNGCKILRLWDVISLLVFNKSLSNLAVLLIIRRSFQWCWWNFPYLSMWKVGKNCERVHYCIPTSSVDTRIILPVMIKATLKLSAGLCSSRAWWPLVPNFCPRATR